MPSNAQSDPASRLLLQFDCKIAQSRIRVDEHKPDSNAVQADHVTEIVIVSRERRRRPRKPAPTANREQLIDIDHALRELGEARRELAAIPDDLNRWERKAAMSEPLSRLDLVRRFVDGVLAKAGWSTT